MPAPSTRARTATLLAVVAALAAPPSATGQVNVEALRSDEPPLGWSGMIGADLTVRTGNVDLVQVDVEVTQYRVTEGVTTLLVGNGGVGLLGGEIDGVFVMLPERSAHVDADDQCRLGHPLLAGLGTCQHRPQ